MASPRGLARLSLTRLGGLLRWLLWAGALALPVTTLAASVSAQDDDGRTVTLPAPAQRIISLAPHTTELLYAAGAGEQVVATVRYADYPEQARKLPLVGDAHALDLERIAALKPDLLVVWMHGSSERQIERLRALGIPMFHSQPGKLPQIADSLRRLGALTGHTAEADNAARAYTQQLDALQRQYAGRRPLRVFYQVWQQPILTVNSDHLINSVIELCGGVNVFASQRALVPTLTAESVLAARPQVLVTASLGAKPDDTLALWRPFKSFEPLATGHVVWLETDWISRPTPRILKGATQLCTRLDEIRAELSASH